MLDDGELPAGSRGVEGSVAAFVLAADLATLSHQQAQNVQMSCGESAERVNKCVAESFKIKCENDLKLGSNLHLKSLIECMTDIVKN